CVFGVNHDMQRGAGRVMFLVLGLALAPWRPKSRRNRGEIVKAILFTALAASAILLASPALADNQGQDQTPLPPAAAPAPAAAPTTPTPTPTPGPVLPTAGHA